MTVQTTPINAGAVIVRRPNSVRLMWLCAGLALLALLCAASVTFGVRAVALDDILAALGGTTDTISQAAVAKRIPRTILAALAGAALGLSGGVMQGVTRNPLADPGLLGINTGAALAVVIGIAFFGMAAANVYIWTAIAGAALTAVFVFLVGSLGRGGPTPLKLALAGTATSVTLHSFINAVVLPRNDIADSVQAWQVGGVGGASYASIGHVLPFLVAGAIISLLSARKLNSLALGDEMAAGLGENVLVVRLVAAFGAVILCGAVTAVCGPIIFVGLVVPHLCRLLSGPDYRWLLPLAAVVGACLLVGADVAGRLIARPTELDVGLVTAFIGAPFFIWIVRRQRVREL